MSVYLEFVRGVPSTAQTDDDLNDDVRPLQGVEYLQLFNSVTGQWGQVGFKISHYGRWPADALGPDLANAFLPPGNNGLIHLGSVVPRVEELRAALPTILAGIDETGHKEATELRTCLKAFMASIDQALTESPDGTGFAIITG